MRKSASIMVAISLASAGALAAAERDLDHAPSREEIAVDRDLSLYDDGGDFTSKMSDHGVIPGISLLRDFVWSHWTQKKRGYVRLAVSYIDTTTTSHIFVEPTSEGEWHVSVLQFLNWYGAVGVSRWSALDGPLVASLARKPPREDDVHGGADVLVFLGTDGKEVWRL